VQTTEHVETRSTSKKCQELTLIRLTLWAGDVSVRRTCCRQRL
jgi:hypothetical protein